MSTEPVVSDQYRKFSANALGGHSVVSYELRPCSGTGKRPCGYVRRVQVHRRTDAQGEHVIYWHELCSACEAQYSADKHRLAADKFDKRAERIRQVRRARKQKRPS
jgi:hypothetical protein